MAFFSHLAIGATAFFVGRYDGDWMEFGIILAV
jgi:hypothetical protein